MIFNIQYPQARPPSTSALPFFPTSVRLLSYFLGSFGLFLSVFGLGSGLSLVQLCHFTLSPIHLSLSRSFRLAFFFAFFRDCSRAHAPHLSTFLAYWNWLLFIPISLALSLSWILFVVELFTYIYPAYLLSYIFCYTIIANHQLNQMISTCCPPNPPSSFSTLFRD